MGRKWEGRFTRTYREKGHNGSPSRKLFIGACERQTAPISAAPAYADGPKADDTLSRTSYENLVGEHLAIGL